MIIQDSVLKEYLKNVYFVTGTPCGGKTTISRTLAAKYGLALYDVDERFPGHQKRSNGKDQPAMNRIFRDADEFFGRTVEEYSRWLLDNTREQLDFVTLDLIALSQGRKVLCDLHLTLEEAAALTEPGRIVFLLREPSRLVEEYCARKDHSDFKRFIESASDVERAKETCNATLERLNRDHYFRVRESGYFWLERTPESTVEKTAEAVAKHFCLG